MVATGFDLHRCFSVVGLVVVFAAAPAAAEKKPAHPLDDACRDGNAAACCQRLQGAPLGDRDPKRAKGTNTITVDLRGRSSAPTLSDRSILAFEKPMKVVVKAAPGLPVLLVNGTGKDAEMVRGEVAKGGELSLRVERFHPDARLFSTGICKTQPAGLRVSPKPQIVGVLGRSKAVGLGLEGSIANSSLNQAFDAAAAEMNRGRELYNSSCKACHSLDGTRLVGPTFRNLAGSTVELSDGRKVKADRAYLRRAIVEPHKDVRKGYPPAMPPFRRNDADIDALVLFIQTQHD